MTLKKLALTVFALTAGAGAVAQELAGETKSKSNELWLTTGFATYHFQSEKDLNGRNPGVGLEYRFADALSVTAGRFFNSDRQHSRYAGLYYQPWQYNGVRLGAVVGGFDGYPKMRDGGWFVAAARQHGLTMPTHDRLLAGLPHPPGG